MSLSSITLALAVVSAAAYLGVFLATLHRTRRRTVESEELAFPAISLLKPLKGLEEALEANLRSVYEQSYPSAVEVIVATADADDPALPIARSVAADYPAIPTRFVLSDPDFGENPKVSNLAGALEDARHSIVLQTDGNVLLPPGYLRHVVAEMVAGDADLLSSLIVGRGEQSVGATLENLQLTTCISPAMSAAYELFGVPCVVGKSLLIRRSALEAVGGFESLRDLLAEDYLLGERMKAAGHRVLISAWPVENINRKTTVESFLSRHSRWLKMRVVIHLGGFAADLLANPVPFAVLAALVGGVGSLALPLAGAIVASKIAADAYLMRRLRGQWLSLRRLWISPVRDVLMVGIWVYSLFSRTIVWRGERRRIGKGSRLCKEQPSAPLGAPVSGPGAPAGARRR